MAQEYQIIADRDDKWLLRTKCCKCGKPAEVEEYKSIVETADILESVLKYAQCADCARAETLAQLEKERLEVEYERRRKMAETYNRRRQESRIDNYLLGYDNNDPRANPELFQWCGERQDQCQLLTGETGQCKTRILQHYALQQLKAGRTVFYSPVIDLLDELAALGKYPERTRAFIFQLYRFDILILEDFGKESLTESKKSRLWQILEKRSIRYIQEQNITSGRWLAYQRIDRRDGWQLWMTTNLNTDDIFIRFEALGNTKSGDPLNRRLLEMCAVWPEK
jgi:DNA replication protein DnaC